MEVPSQEVDPLLPTRNNRGKVLIEDDRENGGCKGRVGEIIHRPAKDLTLLNWHAELKDAVTRGIGDGVNFVSPCPRVSLSLLY